MDGSQPKREQISRENRTASPRAFPASFVYRSIDRDELTIGRGPENDVDPLIGECQSGRPFCGARPTATASMI